MMKRKISLLVELILIVSLLAGCSIRDIHKTGNLGEAGSEVVFELTGSLPEIPQNVMSYKIIPPGITTDYVSSIGETLGFTGQVSITDSNIITMSKPDAQELLRVYVNSGAIEYTCLSELFPVSPDLPDYEQAIEIAIHFLENSDLWHSDLVVDEVTVGGTAQGKASHLLVRFSRYIEGIPLTGPGNIFAVRIGDNGKVIQLLARYPEIEPDKEVQCIDPEIAFDKLKDGEGIFSLPVDCKKVEINTISPGYYMDIIEEKQEYLIPYYIFQGDCKNSKGDSIQDFTGWVKAVY